PEEPSGGRERSERAAYRAAFRDSSGLTGDHGAQRAWPQKRARSALDAEPLVQLPFGVGDHWERQLGLVLGQFRDGGVEDDDLPDAVGADLGMARDDGAEVEVA